MLISTPMDQNSAGDIPQTTITIFADGSASQEETGYDGQWKRG